MGGDGIEPPTSSMSTNTCKLALSQPAASFHWSEIVPTSLLASDSTVHE